MDQDIMDLDLLLKQFGGVRSDQRVEQCQRIFKNFWHGNWPMMKEELECVFPSLYLEKPFHFLEIRISQYTTVRPLSLACRHGELDFLDFIPMLGDQRPSLDPRFIHNSLLECVRHGHRDCFCQLMEIMFKQHVIQSDQKWQEELFASVMLRKFDDIASILQREQEVRNSIADEIMEIDLLNILLSQSCPPPSYLGVFIRRGVDVNGHGSSGLTPLVSTVLAENTEGLRFLLRSGVRTSDKNFQAVMGDRCNALMCSACLKETKMLKILLEFLPLENVDDKSQELGWTALSYACYFGNAKSVYLLAAHGADLKIRDNRGKCLIQIAVESGSLECVSFLSERTPEYDVGLDATLDNGCFLLGMAAMRGCVDIVGWLLDHGAEIDSTDQHSNTALLIACYFDQVGLLELLVKRGANVCVQDRQDRPVILYAIENRSVQSLRILLDTPADPMARHGGVYKLLSRADDSVEILECLLDHEADINAKGPGERTALMQACEQRYGEVVQLLVERGADVDITDVFGQNAMWYAVKCKPLPVEIIKILLEANANLDIKNNAGDSLLSVLQRNEIVRNEDLTDCIFASGALVKNGYLKPMHKKVIATEPTNLIYWLKYSLQYRVFEWGLTRQAIIDQIAFQVTSQGVCPGKIQHGASSYSPLVVAFIIGEAILIRYFLANLYFFAEDLSELRKDLTFKFYMTTNQYSEDVCRFYHQLVRQPLSLQTLSFLAASKAISQSGPPCLRPHRVHSLRETIPEIFKSVLSFQTAMSKTCPSKMRDLNPSLLPPYGSWWDHTPSRCPVPCRYCLFVCWTF